MPFEMPEPDWFGRSHEVPVAEGTVTGGSGAADGAAPTQLALDGSSEPAATESNAPAQAVTSTAQGTAQAGAAQAEAPQAAASQATTTQTSTNQAGTNQAGSGTTGGVALAPADSVPLLASREAAFVAGYPDTSQAIAPTNPDSSGATAAASPNNGSATTENAGSFKVQIASYLSMEAVEREWVRLKRA